MATNNQEEGDESRARNNHHMVDVEGVPISLTTESLVKLTSDVAKLGSGSFADVYKHICPVTNKVIALKRLKNTTTKRSKPIAKEFLREITVHRDLDHKNILKFFGHVKDSKAGIYLVIQFADRGSLSDLMENEMLERNKILIYIEQILQGLTYLHNYTSKLGQKQPIAHRDLRCHNVLMMADGTLKIADFGLCKRLVEMAEASGISSRRGNSYWVGPELVDKRPRRDLPAETLVLTDVWSLGVLILELYYYGAWRVPYINFYCTAEEYIFKLGRGWGPKTPPRAPEDVKTLLGWCFHYVIDERTSAENLLKHVQKIDGKRKAHLIITEPIENHSEPSSNSEDTLQSLDTATTIETPDTSYTTNGLEIDPLTLHNLDDTKYLTKLHDPTTLVPPSLDQQNKIIKSITESELNRYTAKDDEKFILEDISSHDGTYQVKRKESGKNEFRVHFRGDGKKLSLKLEGRVETIFSIDSSDKRNRCLSAALAGGIFARVNKSNEILKTLGFTKLVMEVNSVGEEGAMTLDTMSPKSRRRLETVPGASSEGSQDVFYSAKSELESLTGSTTEFTFDERNLDIKKSKREEYKYTIRYREDKTEIGYFNTLLDQSKCEILVTPDSNTALVVTVVAYYYQQKSKKIKKFKWKEKLSKKSGSSTFYTP